MGSKYRVGHIAFVVQDLDAAMDFMKSLGAEVSEKKLFENKKHDLNDADHWTVTYCKGTLGALGFEIFHPDGPGTPYSEFLEKTGGGIHHISFDDLGDVQQLPGVSHRASPELLHDQIHAYPFLKKHGLAVLRQSML